MVPFTKNLTTVPLRYLSKKRRARAISFLEALGGGGAGKTLTV